MQFSSPHNKEDLISSPDRPEFYAMCENGHVYNVKEEYVSDKRRKTGRRLTRIDVLTGASLMNKPLMVLPENFNDTVPWLMVNIIKLINDNEELKYLTDSLTSDIESLERRIRHNIGDIGTEF